MSKYYIYGAWRNFFPAAQQQYLILTFCLFDHRAIGWAWRHSAINSAVQSRAEPKSCDSAILARMYENPTVPYGNHKVLSANRCRTYDDSSIE